MKRNLTPLLLVALGVAVISTALFYTLVTSRYSAGVKAMGSHKAVTASRDLEPGAVLSAEDIQEVPWTDSEPAKGAFRSAKSVTGMTVIRRVRSGDLVLESSVASAEGGGLGIPVGMRAVSVHVADSSGVMELLRPGHKVDVHAVRQTGQSEFSIRTVLENAEVLRISAKPEVTSGRPVLPVVTLLMKADVSDAVALADSAGVIRLALRNPVDPAERPRGGLAIATVMRADARIPAAAPRPLPARRPVVAPLPKPSSNSTCPEPRESLSVAPSPSLAPAVPAPGR